MPAKSGPSQERARAVAAILTARSPLQLRFFGRLFQRDLAASFHAVRYSGAIPQESGPLVVFANHPSWWDGELFVWLATTIFAKRRGFTPIDAAMLERYRFFRKLGAFAVKGDYASAASFLGVGEAVLGRDDGLMLVNAEGRFRDVRERPLRLAPGLAHLARLVPQARFMPLAVEYAFWDERRPNCLLRFGEAVPGYAVSTRASSALDDALASSMDALAADALSRDPARFTTLLDGRTRINAVYDVWRRTRAWTHGRRFDASHGAPT